jgi:hypothetical protein
MWLVNMGSTNLPPHKSKRRASKGVMFFYGKSILVKTNCIFNLQGESYAPARNNKIIELFCFSFLSSSISSLYRHPVVGFAISNFCSPLLLLYPVEANLLILSHHLYRQTGQELCFSSNGRMQTEWCIYCHMVQTEWCICFYRHLSYLGAHFKFILAHSTLSRIGNMMGIVPMKD